MSLKFTALAVLLAATVPQTASAAQFMFRLEGSRNASFILPETPTSFTELQTNFTNISGTFNGVETTASLINFGRSNGIFSAAALNIQAPGLGFTQFTGPTLFTGTTANPVFTTGVFTLNSLVSGRSTLTISELATGAVPEPATWAMLVTGFGLVGAGMRRRQTMTKAIA